MKIQGQIGFTMIEVLISVFVLAFGVIGAAGMQLAAFRTSHQSVFHTAALELAAEMADKMRANAILMRQDDGGNPFLQVNYKATAEPAAPASLCYGESANCSAEALASFDIYEWEKRIMATLPGGHAVICRDERPWDSGIGAYKWECDASSTDERNESLVIKIGWQAKNPDGSLARDANSQFLPSVALTVEPYIK